MQILFKSTLLLFFLLMLCSGDAAVFYILPKNIRLDSLISSGYPKRIGEQYISILKNQKYRHKSFFIADNRENLIYFFDKKGDFVAKSPMIDGAEKQTNDTERIKKALLYWDEKAALLGFKRDKDRKFVDSRGKGRKYSDRLVYNFVAEEKLRFFPKGVYRVLKVYSDKKSYVGGENNVYTITTYDGKEISKAIHGLYRTQYRIDALNQLLNKMNNNTDNPSVNEVYRKEILNNQQNAKYNNSYGCLNVPEEFLRATNKRASGSLLFVMGESKNDYLLD